MYFKERIDFTAATANATTFVTRHIQGKLMRVRLVKGTYTTAQLLVVGLKGESTSQCFFTNRFKTSDISYYPRLNAQTAAGLSSFVISEPVFLANDRIKVWVPTSTDASALTGSIVFTVDGSPGHGGDTGI